MHLPHALVSATLYFGGILSAQSGFSKSVPAAEIMILIGYNDLHFAAKTPPQYRSEYSKLLDALRANHPEPRIHCIAMLYTDRPKNEETGFSADDCRATLELLVKERQTTDDRIFFIQGDANSSRHNPQDDKPQDPVHLSVGGASQRASEPYSMIGIQNHV